LLRGFLIFGAIRKRFSLLPLAICLLPFDFLLRLRGSAVERAILAPVMPTRKRHFARARLQTLTQPLRQAF
jgi:hypothetical protein